jgi:hypothetical protein
MPLFYKEGLGEITNKINSIGEVIFGTEGEKRDLKELIPFLHGIFHLSLTIHPSMLFFQEPF